ncbi:MAG: hypothetical protein AB1938_01665 [Myxococcota bacterium]
MRALIVLAVFLSSAPETEVDLPAGLSTFLETGQWDGTPKAFRVIALSHLADGCAQQGQAEPLKREAAHRCVKRTFELALKTQRGKPASVADALWLTHANLILGAGDRVGPCLDEALHRALSEKLAAKSLEDPLAHAPSYAALPLRWPADQSATLASLGRYDAAHGTSLVTAPLAAWARVLEEKGMNAKYALPMSEVTGRGPGASFPRGCAQSFISRYLAEVDASRSAEWWAAYREHFLVRVAGLPGFREWPRGVERKADVDSGPILLGVGAAASAFGISAARAQGDAALAVELEAAADLVLSTGAGGAAASTVLAQSIRFQARTQPRLVR